MISIITPTYNERDGIEHFVQTISQVMNELGEPFEIIVVDDNSPDGTARRVTELKANYPNLELLKRAGKLGIGSAYFDGFCKASGEYLIGIDADLSPSTDAIPLFIERLKGGDGMVIGSRYLPESQIHNMTKFKSDGSRVFNFFTRYALGIPLTDITHSNRAFSKETFKEIAPYITTKDHPSFFIECSYWVHRLGHAVSEVPITFTERIIGQSKLDIKNGLRRSFKTIAKLRKSKPLSKTTVKGKV